MESQFNPFVWAYTLTQDEKNHKRNAVEMAMWYSKYHNWTEKFEQEVIDEIIKLREN